MRHRKSGRKLGRTSSHRKAMYRNMVTSLMLHGRIKTTEAKAKELRKVADRIITLGKRVPLSSMDGLEGQELADAKAQRVHAIRLARRYIVDRDARDMVFGEYAERFKERPGGYTRIYKLGFRSGDNAPMTLIELVKEPVGERAVSEDEEAAAPESDEGAAEE
jgi:large subunit ribosomal protein L17